MKQPKKILAYKLFKTASLLAVLAFVFIVTRAQAAPRGGNFGRSDWQTIGKMLSKFKQRVAHSDPNSKPVSSAPFFSQLNNTAQAQPLPPIPASDPVASDSAQTTASSTLPASAAFTKPKSAEPASPKPSGNSLASAAESALSNFWQPSKTEKLYGFSKLDPNLSNLLLATAGILLMAGLYLALDKPRQPKPDGRAKNVSVNR